MAALFASALLCATAFAGNIYIDPTGEDWRDGTTQARAVKTIGEGLRKANGGDTVHLQGKYYKEHVVFPKSGANGNRIILDGEGATIEGPDSLYVWGGVLQMQGKSYVTIKRCNINKSKWFGIAVLEWSNNIIIDDNDTKDTFASGIYVNSAWGIDIKNNVVDNACYGNDTTVPHVQECISVGRTSGFTISSNEVKNNWATHFRGGEGIDAKEGSSNGTINNNTVHDLIKLGIYVDSYNAEQNNITVRNNTV